MNDENFDKIVREKIKKNVDMPEKINQLFLKFEKEVVNMEDYNEVNKKMKLSNYVRRGIAVISSGLVIFFGGCVYAHVNGTETIISPLLRNLGINSKYVENATQIGSEVTKNQVKVKMLDAAIDDVTLIVGYQIDIENNNPDAWIEINGEYKINDVNVKPNNTSIDRISDTTYVYYQIYDTNELKLDEAKSIKMNAKITEIKEYTESEKLDSAYAEYGKTYEDGWNFEENITLKKLEDSKIYEFKDTPKAEIFDNVNVFVTEFVEGSYANILKIKTDKTGYDGDVFEKYYKILDDKNQEITTFAENRVYDDVKYNDRIISEKITRNSKLTIEVYVRAGEQDNFKKVVSIPVDISEATEKIQNNSINASNVGEKNGNTAENVEQNLGLKQYENNEYKFKYNENWNVIPKLTTDRVGPNSVYLGALELEIPSTTNSENTSSIYVKVKDNNSTLEKYIEQVKKDAENEYFDKKAESEINLKNQKAYQITFETTDGDSTYIMQDVFTIINGKVYKVTFFGSDKEYNNLKNNISEFLNSFEIK